MPLNNLNLSAHHQEPSQSTNNYWQDVRKHQINTSTSKSTYAFPKDKRFRSNSKLLCDSFYNIPSSIGKSQKSGIGLGNKMSIGNKNCSPSPNKYQINTSDFNTTNRNLSMGKFSLGRQKIKYNGIFTENRNPAPGNYNLRSSLIKEKNSGIMMHSKLPNPKYSNEQNPGPGQYESQKSSAINSTGRYIVSSVRNTPGPTIKKTREYDVSKNRRVPGPGAYNTDKENMNTTGKFYNSRHESSRSRTFSRSARKEEVSKSKKLLPGPGAYRAFTDFGALSYRR